MQCEIKVILLLLASIRLLFTFTCSPQNAEYYLREACKLKRKADKLVSKLAPVKENQ